MSQENDSEQQLLKAQQQLGSVLRFIANQPVGVAPQSLPTTYQPGAALSAPGQQEAQAMQQQQQQQQQLSEHRGHAASALPPLKHIPPHSLMTAQQAVLGAVAATGSGPPPLALATYTRSEPYFPSSSTQPMHSSAGAAAGHVGVSRASTSSMDDSAMAAMGAVSAAQHHRHQSLSASQASLDNDSGDEDDDDGLGSASTPTGAGTGVRKTDNRRAAHTSAEQKRRDDIKHGYEELAMLIPSCQPSNNNGQKLSKAIILQRSIDYLDYLKKHRQQQDQELASLRNEVVALRIMKRNYEQIAKAHHALPPEKTQQVSDAAKFEVFKAVMDTLFQSFDAYIAVNSFEHLSSSIFNWLEEFCKPQNMRGIVISSLQTLQKQPPPGAMYPRT